MDPRAEALLERGGVVRRRELHRAGISYRTLTRLVREGRLRELGPDVLGPPGPPQPDEHLRVRACALSAVVSGPSAALLHGWALAAPPERPHLTVSRVRGGRPPADVVLLRRDLRPDEWLDRSGLRVTSPLRTALDCARDLPLIEGVAAVDSALRARAVPLGRLRQALVALPAGRGRSRLSRVLALADPRCGSVLESLCRVLLVQAGLPPEATQLVVRSRDGGLIGRVDFAWPSARLVVEVDGFAFHADRASYRDDRRRTNALVRAGWVVLRFSWEDVVGSPAVVVAAVREVLTQRVACA